MIALLDTIGPAIWRASWQAAHRCSYSLELIRFAARCLARATQAAVRSGVPTRRSGGDPSGLRLDSSRLGIASRLGSSGLGISSRRGFSSRPVMGREYGSQSSQ